MSALDRILERMPNEEHRQSFLRLVAEAGLKDDSLDLLHLALIQEVGWSSVEALRVERELIENAREDLPSALRAVAGSMAADLAGVVATKTAAETTAAVAHELNSEMHESFAALLTSVKDVATLHDQRLALRVGKFAEAAEAAIARLAAYASAAHERASVLGEAHSRLERLQTRGRVWAGGALIIAALLGGGGVWTADHAASIYHHGWDAGAAVARSEAHRR